MQTWSFGDLGAPELLIILIVVMLILGGLLALVVSTLLNVKRAADVRAADHRRHEDS